MKLNKAGDASFFHFGGGIIGIMFGTPPEVYGLIDLFGGTENYASALSANRVDLIVLRAIKSGETTRYKELSGFPLPDEDATLLRTALTCDATYDWNEDYFDFDDPEFSYRVKLRSQGRVASVDLSMSEGIARVIVDGHEVGRTSFKVGYAAIHSILERHFPNSVEPLRQ
ncbi:MAG: hypothetical protein JSS11_16155 [Verrucomicrobia bacterium]|nr:hypothetical protein [Verrucomicrobiota bacterium]